MLGLFATAFLAGAMRSVAKYNANFNNKSLMVAGPAVIFFIILYIGFKYKPVEKHGPISLSVLVTGPDKNNEIIRNGEIGIRIGDMNVVKKINSEGIAFFAGIDAEYKGQAVDVFPVIEGFRLDTSGKFYLDENAASTNLTISLFRTIDKISINGKVILLKKQTGIPGAEIRFEGMDSTFFTDQFGNFEAELPVKTGAEVRVIISKGADIIYNSVRILADKALLTFPVS